MKSVTLRESTSDTSPQTISYLYGKNGNGLAECRYAPTADTFVKLRDYLAYALTDKGGQWRPHLVVTSVFAVAQESNYLENHIGVVPLWYSEVSEVSSEGKTVYTYENFDADDAPAPSEPFGDAVASVNSAFSQGPQPTGQTVYKGTQGNWSKV